MKLRDVVKLTKLTVQDRERCIAWSVPADRPLPSWITNNPGRFHVSAAKHTHIGLATEPDKPATRVVGNEAYVHGPGLYHIWNAANRSGYWGKGADLQRRAGESVRERLDCLGGRPRDLVVTLIPMPGATPREVADAEAAMIRGHRSPNTNTCNIRIPRR